MKKLDTHTRREGRTFAGLWSRLQSDHGALLRPAAFALAVAWSAGSLGAGTCTINAGSNQQTIDGFGFASVFAPVLTSAQAATFFGTGTGQLGFSLLRVYISETGSFSTDASNTSLAHSYGAKVLGTAWTPPPSMKSNNNAVGGSLNTSQYAAYASYLASAANSIGVDYVSFQNEPDITVTYQSCAWTPAQMETWTANNAPTVGKPIVMPESFHFSDSYSDPTLNNSTAAGHVTIIAGHIYGGGNTVHQNALNHGKHVWMTEHYNSGQTIANAITDAKEVSDCMNNQMSAYIWWRAYHTPPNTTDDLINGSTPQKNGYAIGQFAKYIRPGKVRCSSTYNPSTNVYVTAYHNNGLVIVVVNTGGSSVSQTFALQNVTGVSSLSVNRTSSSENMAAVSSATVTNNAFTYTLPAQSVTTFHQ
jgi:glucuronoarabinoxylan endo-1,4-beta-xylanase